MENTIVLTDENFDQEVINSDTPVLVDFWAPWCGPCRQMSPVVDQIAVEYAGSIKVGKLNVDSSQSTPAQQGLRGIPTLILFKAGKRIGIHVGAISAIDMKKFIDTQLANNV